MKLVLTPDFIQEARIRFALSTTDRLARYIERETLRAVGARNGITIAAKKQLTAGEAADLRRAIEVLERNAEVFTRYSGGTSIVGEGVNRQRAAESLAAAKRVRAIRDRLTAAEL